VSSRRDASSRGAGRGEWGAVASWALAALAAVVVVGAAAVATRTFDRTDEGFYLNAISRPSDDRATILLFGYAYHPVFALVGGNVVALRWAGIVLTVAAGALLTWTVLGRERLVGAGWGRRPWGRIALSVAVGATGLMTLVQYPLTPSYNSLALQALCVVGAGLALVLFDVGRRALMGWGLIGLGGMLTFLAKPTTALIAALLVAAAVLAVLVRDLVLPGLAEGVGRRRTRGLLLGVPVALGTTLGVAGLVLLLSGESPQEMLTRIRVGLEASESLGGHPNILRWDPFPVDRLFVLPTVGVLALLLLGFAGRPRSGRRPHPVRVAVSLVLAAAGGVISLWAWREADVVSDVALNLPAMLWSVAAAAVVLLPWALWRRVGPDVDYVEAAAGGGGRVALVSLVGFLLLAPAAHAFGTNNNLWSSAGRAVTLWVVAAIIVLARVGRPAVPAPAIGVLVLLAPAIATTALSPYRYASMARADVPTAISEHGGTVGLTPADARATRELLDLGSRLGITEQTGIIDLTGDSPGYIYQLGARPLGQDWLLGGYPGSEATAELALAQESCDHLGRALILRAPEARRRIEDSVLERFGLNVARDYTLVGSFTRSRAWVVGRPGDRTDTVEVLAPNPGLKPSGCAD